MRAPIDFWFDFSSPYGFVAARKIDALAARYGCAVDWHPVLLGVVFQRIGTASAVSYPIKGDYVRRDFARNARFHGVTDFRLPSKFPVPTQAPARIFLWAKHADPAAAVRYAKAALDAYFTADRDISNPDVAADVAAESGLDRATARAAIDDPVWKAALKAEVERAIALGVFGAPYVIVDGEPFWGVDRLDQVERWLATGGF